MPTTFKIQIQKQINPIIKVELPAMLSHLCVEKENYSGVSYKPIIAFGYSIFSMLFSFLFFSRIIYILFHLLQLYTVLPWCSSFLCGFRILLKFYSLQLLSFPEKNPELGKPKSNRLFVAESRCCTRKHKLNLIQAILFCCIKLNIIQPPNSVA